MISPTLPSAAMSANGRLRITGRHQNQRHASRPRLAKRKDFDGRLLFAVDQYRIRAGFGIGRTAAQRFLLAAPGDQRLGARDDEDAAGRFRRRDLALNTADWHELLPATRAKARVLGKCFVLDDDGRDARCRVLRHDISNVHRVAETGIEVGDHRRILHLADCAHHLQMRAHRQNIGVGHGVGRRQLKATAPTGIKTRIRGEFAASGLCAAIAIAGRCTSILARNASAPRVLGGICKIP